MTVTARIAQELSATLQQVEAAVRLLDEGHTVPFIARYRKEATQGLDDAQLRTLEERLRYLRNLESERERILGAVREQGKLTPELEAKLLDAETLARLEDLWAPYRPKRQTRAQKAIEAGLEPLADALLAHPERAPEARAQGFVDPEKGVETPKDALDGARDILTQRMAEDADLLETLRERLRRHGVVVSAVREGKEAEGARFRDWFDYRERWADLPSHRALALFRGAAEEILSVTLVDEADVADQPSWGQQAIAARYGVADRGRPGDAWLAQVVWLAWKVKVSLRVEVTLMAELRARAEAGAIQVFADNLRDLLLAAPAGPRVVLGLDPGIRTGVKVAVVDHTGKLLDTATVYPHPPKRDVAGALATLRVLVERHGVELIAIGNGTASRETDRLAATLLGEVKGGAVNKVVVNEAGASVYSASALASEELPQTDVSLRGAVSIARRLQDPLAELVKIDPKSIGVGQYQHDVTPSDLARALDAVVEDCVNAVGVDLNTASPALLQRVAGLSPSLARAVVAWRDANGAFRSRKQLLDVPRLGPRTFEECAGFLRIRGGDDPLDASAVHPEAYPVVQRIQAHTGKALGELMGDASLLRRLRPQAFTDETFGVLTVRDILTELEKPGRDPRPAFVAARFKEGVETLTDLKPDMVLEGTVTNVTHFGAFVDIGVHQDGLVHVSQLADRFVKDPREVVRAGQVVTVRVLEVDLERKRVSLSMRSGKAPPRQERRGSGRERPAPRERSRPQKRKEESGFGSFGDLLKGKRR
ncbi:MAG: RNA-binding transcriptional accessory protein [Alphaproteobacteria bacterium]|nr:RNA-binding transcriptional accessory protein [Alphaproteobacteria bacterium]